MISADFQNGKLDKWSVISDTIRLELADPLHAPWFHFLLQDAQEKTWQFEVHGLELTQAPVSVSYDGFDWVPVDVVQGPSIFRHCFQATSAIISLTPPYTNGMLYGMSLWARRSPHVDLLPLGTRHLEGPLCLHITDFGDRIDKPVVWVVARENPLQAAGSWLAEGLIRFLLSPHPTALLLRQEYRFYVVPLFATAAVAKGESRRSVVWNSESDEASVRRIAELLEASAKSCPMALVVTLSSQVLGTGESVAAELIDTEEIHHWLPEWKIGPVLSSDSFSGWVRQLHPECPGLELCTAWHNSSGDLKNQYDMLQEGRMLAVVIGAALGKDMQAIAAADDPGNMTSFLPKTPRQRRRTETSLF